MKKLVIVAALAVFAATGCSSLSEHSQMELELAAAKYDAELKNDRAQIKLAAAEEKVAIQEVKVQETEASLEAAKKAFSDHVNSK